MLSQALSLQGGKSKKCSQVLRRDAANAMMEILLFCSPFFLVDSPFPAFI
jgi:hypothetical protein